MTVDLFMSKLQGRYPKLRDNPVIRGDIEDGLHRFSPEGLDRLWASFLDEYSYDKAPRWANLNEISRNAGIGKAQRSGGFSFFRCLKCKAAFSLDAAYCPVCKSIASDVEVVVADKKPDGFYDSRQDCGICRHYLKRENGKMCGGPFCSSFGTENTHRLKECRECLCRHCCLETFAGREALQGRTQQLERLYADDKFEKDRLITNGTPKRRYPKSA